MKLKTGVPVHQICEWTGGEAMGDDSRQVTGLNEIHMVEEGDLTFVDHPKYYKMVLASAATTIIINKQRFKH